MYSSALCASQFIRLLGACSRAGAIKSFNIHKRENSDFYFIDFSPYVLFFCTTNIILKKMFRYINGLIFKLAWDYEAVLRIEKNWDCFFSVSYSKWFRFCRVSLRFYDCWIHSHHGWRMELLPSIFVLSSTNTILPAGVSTKDLRTEYLVHEGVPYFWPQIFQQRTYRTL